MLDKKVIRLKVEGRYALFTPPVLSTERISYPCMTQSSARVVLEAILWKPDFQWYIRRILVLKPIKFLSVNRNEINKYGGDSPIYIEASRIQRSSMVLHNVAYIIEASVFMHSTKQYKPDKYIEMFMRRVERGQCFRRPYLGTREFSCEFSFPTEKDVPIEDDILVGTMLFDMYYDKKGIPTPVYVRNVLVKSGVFNCQVPENDSLRMSTHILPERNEEILEALEVAEAQYA